MKHTLFNALALTATLTFFVPVAQAESVRFQFGNGQPDSIYEPFGRSLEAVGVDSVER